jgi:hypothetical protein
MEPTDLALFITVAGTAAVISLALALIRGIWMGRLPGLRVVAPATLFALLAVGLLMSLQPSTPATMVAGVAVASAPCAGAAGHFVGVSEVGERARLTGTGSIDGGCAIWAAIEDPRTGSFWLQGPAQAAGENWTLHLVLGPEPAARQPLAYRATVFAIDAETSADWLAAARTGEYPLRIATVPAPESWLAVALPLGVAAARGS